MGFMKNSLTFVIIFWILQSIVVLLIFINGKHLSNVNYMDLVPFYMFYVVIYPCIIIVIYINQQYISSQLIQQKDDHEENNCEAYTDSEIDMNIKENVEYKRESLTNRSEFSSLINHYV